MNKTILYKGTVALIGLSMALPVFAQGTPTVTSVETTVAPKEVVVDAKMAKKMTTAKEMAGKEIKRRVDSMNELILRVSQMKKVNDTDKNTLNSQMKAQIDALNALNAKIQADTDPAVLKEDIKLITDSYRIYALVMPRNRIIAQADRIVNTAEELGTAGSKIETRMVEAMNAGRDISKLEPTLADMKAKVADAVLQAQNAVAAVVALVPDQGDKAVMKTNQDALAKAKLALKTGIADLKTAQADAKILAKGLRTLKSVTSVVAPKVDETKKVEDTKKPE